MFQWYKSATVCYVYFCDIDSDIEANLASSRWVTRGWTLQELIAPREVIFYSADWKPLGKRSELSVCLSAVTRIDKPFLEGRSLDEASIAQRMSWAATRSTSRKEDEAYCLLGIFNVNMPLIYGEGQKAFKRLQEVLVREYPEDHSLFAWGTVVTRLSNQVDNVRPPELKSLDLNYDPETTDIEFCGLFAKEAKDFQHSGQLVCALDVGYFSFLNGPSVTVLNSHTTQVILPRYGQIWISRCLKRPRIGR
jgi:hypothetical protein